MILYELITGELPFRGETRMLIVQILKEEPPSPRMQQLQDLDRRESNEDKLLHGRIYIAVCLGSTPPSPLHAIV